MNCNWKPYFAFVLIFTLLGGINYVSASDYIAIDLSSSDFAQTYPNGISDGYQAGERDFGISPSCHHLERLCGKRCGSQSQRF